MLFLLSIWSGVSIFSPFPLWFIFCLALFGSSFSKSGISVVSDCLSILLSASLSTFLLASSSAFLSYSWTLAKFDGTDAKNSQDYLDFLYIFSNQLFYSYYHME